MQVGAGQIGLVQIGARQISTRKVQPAQIGFAKAGAAQPLLCVAAEQAAAQGPLFQADVALISPTRTETRSLSSKGC